MRRRMGKAELETPRTPEALHPRRNGKVVIRDTPLETSVTGTQRLEGGSEEIN